MSGKIDDLVDGGRSEAKVHYEEQKKEGLRAIDAALEACGSLREDQILGRSPLDPHPLHERARRRGIPKKIKMGLEGLRRRHASVAQELEAKHIDHPDALTWTWLTIEKDGEDIRERIRKVGSAGHEHAGHYPVPHVLADLIASLLVTQERGHLIRGAGQGDLVRKKAELLRREVATYRRDREIDRKDMRTILAAKEAIERESTRLEEISEEVGRRQEEATGRAIRDAVECLSPVSRGELLIELLRRGKASLFARYMAQFSPAEQEERIREVVEDAGAVIELTTLGAGNQATRQTWEKGDRGTLGPAVAPAPLFTDGHLGPEGAPESETVDTDVEYLRKVREAIRKDPERHLREFALTWNNDIAYHLMVVDEEKREKRPAEWRDWRRELERLGRSLDALARAPGSATKNVWALETHKRARRIRDSLVMKAQEKGEAVDLTWLHNQLAWTTRRARSRQRVAEILREEARLPREAEEQRRWLATTHVPHVVRKDVLPLEPETPLRDPRERDHVPALLSSEEHRVDEELTQAALSYQVRYLCAHLTEHDPPNEDVVRSMIRSLTGLMRQCSNHSALEIRQEDVTKILSEVGGRSDLWEDVAASLPLWAPARGARTGG